LKMTKCFKCMLCFAWRTVGTWRWWLRSALLSFGLGISTKIYRFEKLNQRSSMFSVILTLFIKSSCCSSIN
jgi:hypothetical protein